MTDGVEGDKLGKFIVVGHRGSGMNMLQSSDPRMKRWRENSIKSLNNAAKFNLDFVEFDVQVALSSLSCFFAGESSVGSRRLIAAKFSRIGACIPLFAGEEKK